jgi:large subunit ribosomal protein L31
MREAIHPVYREVIFKDISTGDMFMTRSTVAAKDTVKWKDGQDYPVIACEITSFSHPFYTGQQRVMDTEGRIDKFMKKYQKSAGKK